MGLSVQVRRGIGFKLEIQEQGEEGGPYLVLETTFQGISDQDEDSLPHFGLSGHPAPMCCRGKFGMFLLLRATRCGCMFSNQVLTTLIYGR